MLQRSGASGVPFFMLEVDNAGNRFRRAGAQGFPHSRFGGGCPKLAVHAAFTQPGQIFVEAVEMPDGAEFLTVARTLEGPQGAALPALGVGAKPGAVAATPVGPACRLCERSGCLSRAEPPVTRPLGLDEMVTGLSAFDFQ